MYRAFNLKNISFEKQYEEELLNQYNQQYENDCKKIRKNIEDFVLSDKSLNGSALQDAFFPTGFSPDVFISHSHEDENFAKAFAQYLEDSFGIKSFIDSTVWGGFKELQDSLDNYFIKMQGRNYTRADQYRVISHVHLMLNTALMQMLDRCEAFFLLNTPQSITIDDLIGNSTYSSWIFSEIGMFHLIEKHKPQRTVQESYFSARIKQKVDFTDFTLLTNDDLIEWKKCKNQYFMQNILALDILYDIKPLKKDGKNL